MADDINVGAISEALNNKTDLDFNNMSPSSVSKDEITSWGMPDYSAGVDLSSTLQAANSSWTAPSDGVLLGYTRGNDSVFLYREKGCTNDYAYSKDILLGLNGEAYVFITDSLFINKGQAVYNNASGTLTGRVFFYPLKGVN